MTQASEDAVRVYLAVFPSEEVVERVAEVERQRGSPGAMLFLHHPLNVRDDGSYRIIEASTFELLRREGVSAYVLHAPLDCSEEVSTSLSLARALGATVEGRFAPFAGGLSGVRGRVDPEPFSSFVEKVGRVVEVRRPPQVLYAGRPVERVAVVAGEGYDPETILDAARSGCDTYVTGVWKVGGLEDVAAPAWERAGMNMVGASHYATELVVLRDAILPYFRNRGIDARLVRQARPAP